MDDVTLAQFMSKVEIQPNGCWHWTGHITEDGYGTFYIDGRNELAHRVSYQHFSGPIPKGWEVDHLCHTREVLTCPGGKTDLHRRCVNPFTDLEAVTPEVNNARGKTANKTRCDYGHEFTEANTYIDPTTGGRSCRECRAERGRRWVAEHNPGVRHGTETHCPQGHPYEGDNLYLIPSTGGRMCRICKRISGRESARRKRAAAKATRQSAA
jgi:hypothetical protein